MTHYLSQYAKFSTKEQMDTAARQHVDCHINAMNKTDLAVLEMIRCYSVKYLAAHLKHETIEKKLSLSNSTIRRTLRKLEKLQIIERIHFVRPVMSGLGANIYVILPFNDQGILISGTSGNEVHSDAVEAQDFEGEASFYKSQKPKDLIKTSHSVVEKLSTTLFGRMKEILSISGDVSKARDLFGIHRALSGMMLKYEIHKGKEAVFEALSLRATQIAVVAQKSRGIRSLPGYFSGILRQLICDELFSESYKEFSVAVDDFYCPGY
ncbi:hypothetical protein [Sporosarcina sp. A2]|uniref:hypothetical protein n=1 Tax=Sporosarcina sp. A2 TaxID=3393449 RepID=UPI003D79E4A8